MSKVDASQERSLWGLQTAACRAALLKLTPMLLVVVFAGCATKGERASALDHSSGGRGYNASAAHGPESGGLSADSGGQSSTQAGATGKRRKSGGGAGGAQGGPDAMDASSADGTDDTLAEDERADDDSSLTGGGPGTGKPGKRGSRGRGARSGGQTIAGGTGASGNGAAQGDSANDGTVAGTDGRAAGGSKGKRGARRRGANGAPGSSDESDAMGAAGDEDSDTQIAAVEVPSGKVEVNEEYQPLTLGGALPVVLGVNEEGRFDFDQYALRDEVKVILDGLAETLKTAEYDRLDVFGYTDRIGAVDYNQRLSELRAYAVAQYLMRRGVPESKIRYEGRGDKDSLTRADECQGLSREDLITCLQKDRRVEIEASIHRKHATVVQ
jgi:outer membrane protein OmpA-like peptidoglycan-associated protein